MDHERARLANTEDAGIERVLGNASVYFLHRRFQVGQRTAVFIEITGIDRGDGAGLLGKGFCAGGFHLKLLGVQYARSDYFTVKAQ